MGLFKPAWQSSNEKKAIRAVEKLVDQDTLAYLAENAESTTVKESAASKLTEHGARKLTDQRVLVDIAQKAKDLKTRVAAMETLAARETLPKDLEEPLNRDLKELAKQERIEICTEIITKRKGEIIHEQSWEGHRGTTFKYECHTTLYCESCDQKTPQKLVYIMRLTNDGQFDRASYDKAIASCEICSLEVTLGNVWDFYRR